MTPAIPLDADASSPLTPSPGISALFIVLGAAYFLHHLTCRGTLFISEELEDTKKVYYDASLLVSSTSSSTPTACSTGSFTFQSVEDEATTLRISFLTVSPLLLLLMQIVSLVAIARCAYNLRVLKKKIQLIVETRV
ncbi:hypothetical protein B0H17DRAFT_1129331 [Mycena rosella]|uniref:Uncharacterized protein n=1 Tax=Mycena rosella TaxID=1033263 RepID=A0AAD7GQ55_MYCRO|nr:hypothetical protein B0H17DRAFT_1129331 [Mycena rosella]